MRKIILTSLALVFAMGIFMTSVYQSSAQTAQENMETEVLEFEVTEAQEPTPTERLVDYPLPWPGILPDHFLYPVKMIRDRIWFWLTTDSLKKAELLLKFADKRIWAAQMLVDKGKADLGVTTATKAEKYLERAISQTKVAKEKGKDVTAFLEKRKPKFKNV